MDDTDPKPIDYSGLIILALSYPGYLILDFLGRRQMGYTAWMILIAIMVAVRGRWELRKHIWLWVVAAVLLLLHIPLLFIVQWPHHTWIPGVALLPFVVADGLFDYAVIGIVERIVAKFAPADDDQPRDDGEGPKNGSILGLDQ